MTRKGRRSALIAAALIAVSALLGSCSRLLGWGVLVWSAEDPYIPSGTVLPVYIRSNIDQVWVVGIPEELKAEGDQRDKVELPLWSLEFVGSRKKAQDWADRFADLAGLYAETVQDGLPIRSEPDNSANRVYRLRLGQIVKILGKVEGAPAMGGDAALPGEWLRVLTEDGAMGFCFSYRLRLFEHRGGPLAAARPDQGPAAEDPKLDILLSRSWTPDWFKEMVDKRRIDLKRFSEKWGFFPGQDTGVARVSTPELELSYSYTAIVPQGDGVWRLEGAPVELTLRNDSLLAVKYLVEGGAQRTLLFTALPVSTADLIVQETERRAAVYASLRGRGPVFRSENYGTMAFGEEGTFTWSGYDLLVPSVVPPTVRGTGKLEMDLFLETPLSANYDGAFTLSFENREDAAAPGAKASFLYKLEPQGLRLEPIPSSAVEGVLVLRRAASPLVIYFSPSEY